MKLCANASPVTGWKVKVGLCVIVIPGEAPSEVEALVAGTSVTVPLRLLCSE